MREFVEFVAFVAPALLAEVVFFGSAWLWRRQRPDSWSRLQAWFRSRTQLQTALLLAPAYLALGLLFTFGDSLSSWMGGKPVATMHFQWIILSAGMAIFMTLINALNNKKRPEPEDWLLWDLEKP